jgi:hypothetical protein
MHVTQETCIKFPIQEGKILAGYLCLSRTEGAYGSLQFGTVHRGSLQFVMVRHGSLQFVTVRCGSVQIERGSRKTENPVL